MKILIITTNDYKEYRSRCLKKIWLEKRNSPVVEKNESANKDEFILIHELARKIKDNGTLINYNSNHDVMVKQTEEKMSKNEIIYHAMFKYDDTYVKYDILVRHNDKLDIYLIKGTVRIEEKYYHELALQYYVLQQLGYEVGDMYIIYINNDYIRDDELEINKLFNVGNVTSQVINLIDEVQQNIQLIKDTLKETKEPDVNLGEYCLKASGESDKSDCDCKKYCFKDIPQNNVFDIHRMTIPTMFKYYQKGIIEYKDLVKQKGIKGNQRIQIECELNDHKIINRDEISKFIDNLNYPLYFLDFETFHPAIPPYKGVKPYQQIPFQYSLHYKQTQNDNLKHSEYLAKEGKDCTREFAEKLIQDLGKEGDIVVYNAPFESTRIKELADIYVDLKDDLLKLKERIVDLMYVFQKKYYYQKEMKGSYSIKYVLPAFFPNDEELNYSRLNIQNGSMAMNVFSTLHLKAESEINQIRQDLLKYCHLDTLAMVRILEKLEDLSV